jgi:hypothetical protein
MSVSSVASGLFSSSEIHLLLQIEVRVEKVSERKTGVPAKKEEAEKSVVESGLAGYAPRFLLATLPSNALRVWLDPHIRDIGSV